MPSFLEFFTTWFFDPVAVTALVVAGFLYAMGVVKVRKRSERWPLRNTILFYALGLGSYAFVSLGFLGLFSTQLRWAFATRLALLIFIVPLAIAAGRPVDLLRLSLEQRGQERLDRIWNSRIVRLCGNAMFATVFVAIVLFVFLFPVSGWLRTNSWAEAVITIIVPLLGLVMVLPMSSANVRNATSVFLALEFLLTFGELLIDAVPGIVLRLQVHVVDGLSTVHSTLGWWPSALRDQQYAGDMLWTIAEIADLPVLILLLVRWSRSDKRDSHKVDSLSEEEYERLATEHLQRRNY